MPTPIRSPDIQSSVVDERDRRLRHDAPLAPSAQQGSIPPAGESEYAPASDSSAVACLDATALRLGAIVPIAGRS